MKQAVKLMPMHAAEIVHSARMRRAALDNLTLRSVQLLETMWLRSRGVSNGGLTLWTFPS